MKSPALLIALIFTLICLGCSDNDIEEYPVTVPNPDVTVLKYLALGDSYTIGQSVCPACRFPEQLKDSLSARLNKQFSVDVIAQTGWTTTNLINAITTENPSSDYDFVTLLIGVNNQFQNRPFSIYQSEFPQLVNKAIGFAKGDLNRVIVVSIPDYAFTPYGQGSSNPQNISSGIDQYNAFAKEYCLTRNIKFIDITPITRRGLEDPELVASDGLHPSEKAYTAFVCLLLPWALEILR